MAKVDGIPVDDDRRQQIQPGDPVMLPLSGSITDFTLTADAQGTLEGMVGFALVEANLGAALHIGIEDPLDDKESALDAADFPKRGRKIVLSGIGCEFPEQLARSDLSGGHRGSTAEEIRPV